MNYCTAFHGFNYCGNLRDKETVLILGASGGVGIAAIDVANAMGASVIAAASTKKINAQLAKVDSSGTLAMLEKMKNKVVEDESLAQAYGDMAEADKSVDDEINAALQGSTHPSTDSLAAMKAKLGIT